MRALAHPLRIRLLETLLTRREATATELAGLLGQTTANCSFHLRKLAEYGYIERAGDSSGREKPWRATDPTQRFVADPADPASASAATAVGAAFREWDFARMKRLMVGRTRRGGPAPPSSRAPR